MSGYGGAELPEGTAIGIATTYGQSRSMPTWTAAAVKLAREFAKGLAEAGLTVVSGLARGIDGAAHEGAFPHTIGVIASGIDIAYPPQHAELQNRIATEGLLLAEQPPGTEPRGSHFPSRNRIIAGLAGGTLVVEAAVKSGSLITARLAGEAGIVKKLMICWALLAIPVVLDGFNTPTGSISVVQMLVDMLYRAPPPACSGAAR